MMKKNFFLITFLIALLLNAQQNNTTRFFYELSCKPQKDSSRIEKILTILDITSNKSLYRDYNWIAQDSILQKEVEKIQKSGVYSDIGKLVKWPAFTYKIKKEYPEMKILFIDGISQKYFSYTENNPLQWKIQKETGKIKNYEVQKAILDFGGRKWVAWFTKEIPFQDGPYKFHGLPGLIVKIEDTDKNYSWELAGVKKLDKFTELSFTEKLSGFTENVAEISKDKFQISYNNFKKDPLASARTRITPEMMSQKMPGSDTTFGDVLKQQEERIKKFFNSNNNPIERED